MNFKLPIIIAAVVFISVALGLLIAVIDTKNQDVQETVQEVQDEDEQDAQDEQYEQDEAVAIWDTTLPDTVASDSILPQAKLPVLNINGKKNPDVYLQSLDIQVEVTGNIASTRYTMVFKNKTDRVLEGELTFPLPDGRTVTNYALDINGKMRDAVAVEKARATEVFEEIEQRRVDPGLLEKVEGNNFRTRIYPIPAGGTRTISIGYEEELTLERGLLYYRLPMAYSTPLKNFAVKASVWNSSQKPLVPKSDNELRFDVADEGYIASFARENYKPSRALIFALPAPADIPQVVIRPAPSHYFYASMPPNSYYFYASVTPRMQIRKKRWNDNLAIIWDVSLSGSQRNLQREIEMLDMIFAEKKDASASLYFLNNTFKKIAKGNWNELKGFLENAVYDGGTDFSKINLKEIEGKEILFFSDGISTLSDADFLKNYKTKRPVHCIVSSSKADYSVMKFIAGKTRGKFINVNALSSEKLKNELQNETLQFLGTEHGSSVSEVYPSIAMPVHGNFSVAGISKTNDEELNLLFGFGNKVLKKIKVKLEAKQVKKQGNVYRIWAQKKIEELDLDYEKNRTELTELGKQFGVVTRNTSLIVLETLRDYFRYDIKPPVTEPALRAKYEYKLKNTYYVDNSKSNILYRAIAAAEIIKKWWDTDSNDDIYEYEGDGSRRRMGAGGRPRGSGFDEDAVGKEISQPTITIKPIKKDNEYLKKLTGKTAEDYQIYLKLRDDYAYSPTFYFDMADWFYKLNDRETALRILTSIADLELENASLYKLLGYRFKEYGEYELEKFVYLKVIQWRPMEPQSYRDYALALAGNGEMQAALDSLYSLLLRQYSNNIIRRSKGIEYSVLMEINNLIAKKPSLDTSKIDKRLIMSIPVDIRVVINWNMNNTDIDLHVKDPNGEECSYENNKTSIGGRISADVTGSYGPEQFLLKKAIKGKYQVYVNYYGDRQFTEAGPSTVMAEIFTKYSDKTEQRKVVSLQMSKSEKKAGKKEDKKVEVAEFEF